MSSICLKQATKAGITLIKNLFIDYYMIPANGEYVKIYLYILRCLGDATLGASLSINTLADIFDCTEKDVMRALRYWEKTGVLSLEFSDGVLSAIQINDLEKNNSDNMQHTKAATRVISSAKLAEFADNTEIKQLLYIAQKCEIINLYSQRVLSFSLKLSFRRKSSASFRFCAALIPRGECRRYRSIRNSRSLTFPRRRR